MPLSKEELHELRMNNLRPHQFKSGDEWTGNSKGRTPGISVLQQIKKIINESTTQGENRDIAKALAQACIKHALEGDFRFMKEIMDRLDGPIKNDITIGGQSVTVKFDDMETPEDHETPEPPRMPNED